MLLKSNTVDQITIAEIALVLYYFTVIIIYIIRSAKIKSQVRYVFSKSLKVIKTHERAKRRNNPFRKN